MRTVHIVTNLTQVSMDTAAVLRTVLTDNGFAISEELTEDVELIFCIGGDGLFLKALRNFNFPDIPFIGVNTGHLGFFQEIQPEQITDFIELYKNGNYSLQPLTTVRAVAITGEGTEEYLGLNEIVVKGTATNTVHLDVYIEGSFIERFSGDGVLVATPAGSTAYNYSLGGSIVDPRIQLLQMTPIAPMNTIAYRSFTSSILLPSNLKLRIVPEENWDDGICISVDGHEYTHSTLKEITVGFSDKIVKLIRFEGYDFWNKVKSKFL